MVAQKKTDRRPSRTDTMGKKIRFCPKTSCIQKISTIPANLSNYCAKTKKAFTPFCFAKISHEKNQLNPRI